MKWKIFLAIIAALAAMCVLAVSVGAYNWKIGTITKSMHVIVDGVIKYKEKDVCGFVKTDNDTQTVSIIYDTESYNYDGWFSSETPREDLVTDDMSFYYLLQDTSIARS